MRRLMLFSTLVLGIALGTSPAAGAKFNKKIDLGDKAADWKDLKGSDGKTHSLSDYAQAEVLVIAFTCNHCPVARAYEPRFIELQKTYRDRKVRFVAINVSTHPQDSLEHVTARAKEQGYVFDYLHDPSQQVGRNYGALVTPHLYVLDKHRRFAYVGAFDDSMNPANVETHYVRDAVEALLQGKQPEIKESLQFGCGIQYSLEGQRSKGHKGAK